MDILHTIKNYFGLRDETKIIKKPTNELIKKHPNKIPVVIIAKNDIKISKSKYLVDKGVIFSQLLYIIRRYITNLSYDQAIFCFTKNQELVRLSDLIGQIYKYNKSEDDFLYITLSVESTFG